MHKKNIKIVRLYIISLICIVCYFLLENSTIIPELVQISEKGRYSGFPTFFLTGLFKYGLLLVGIGIILILTFLLIRERTKKTIE
jgi:type II secretory pathway component PulF